MKLLSNQRLDLRKPKNVWQIEAGSAEIFLIKGKKGPLVHVASLSKNDLIFGFPEVEESIFLEAHGPCIVKEIALENSLEWVPHILKWLHHYDHFFNFFKNQEVDHFIAANQALDFEEGEIVSAALATFPEYKNDVRWIEIKSGCFKLFDLPGCLLESHTAPFPISHALWLKSSQKTSIATLRSDDVLKSSHFVSSIIYFQKKIVDVLKMIVELEEKRDKKQAKLRQVLDKKLLRSSYKNVASVLGKEESLFFSPLGDPVFKACQLIGLRLDIHFIEPKELKSCVSVEEKIRKICRASKVGYREVALTKNWWRHDSLPLLGFFGDKKEPVALLNRRGDDYDMIDPASGAKKALNADLAKTLHPRAFQFYPPFPDTKLNALSLINFSLGKNRREILAIVCIGIVGAFLSLAPPLLTQVLFDQVIKAYDPTLLPQIVLGLLMATLSVGIFLFTRSYAVLRLMQLIDVRLESAFWARLIALPVQFFRKFTVGNLIQRVYAITDIRELIGGNVIRVLFSGLFSLFYFFVMLFYSKTLAFLGLSVVVFGLVISTICIVFATHIQRKILAIEGSLRGMLVQLIAGVSKLRMSGAEARAFSYFTKEFAQHQTLSFNARRYTNVVTALTAALPSLSTGILFVALILMRQGTQHPLSVGSFIAFLAAYVPFSLAVFDVVNTLIGLVAAVPLWERAKVIVDTQVESSSVKEKPGTLLGEVSLEHISYGYEKEGPLILDNVSIKAAAGEFIALVGPSGSGKSTLVRLLLSFDAPMTGSIYYDGKNLSNLDLLEVRRQIGTVLQNGSLFSGSLYENIVCGGLYSSAEIEEALKLSGFDKDLKTFPMGLQTIVQSGGGTLSVGQAQRLLISRALISKPKILIFDEATSALDNKTQDEVSSRLEEIKVTRIVIAHRLSTVRNANRIYVVEKGKIAQEGSFLDLAQQEGTFKEMLQRQML